MLPLFEKLKISLDFCILLTNSTTWLVKFYKYLFIILHALFVSTEIFSCSMESG